MLLPRPDPWAPDRRASWIVLLLPLPVFFFVWGPWLAGACLFLLLALLLFAPYEPISASLALLLVPAAFYFLRPMPEFIAISAYAALLLIIGALWLLRNLHADKKKGERAQIKD